jgi:hypothetical protein
MREANGALTAQQVNHVFNRSLLAWLRNSSLSNNAKQPMTCYYVRPGLRTKLVIAALTCSALACAQNLQDPPQILKISSALVAPGKDAALSHAVAEQSQALRRLNWPGVCIGLRPVTGPSELIFLTGYTSLADWGRDRNAVENSAELKTRAVAIDELLLQRREISAEFQGEISYRAKYDWSKMRYLDVIKILLRPGHGDEYLKNRKIVLEAHTKAEIDEHLLIYQVSSGYPGTTFFVLRPVETFEGLDLEKRHGDHYLKILGEENRKELHELFAASVQTQEEEFYAVDPALSYVTSSWAGSEKDFWLSHPTGAETTSGGAAQRHTAAPLVRYQ